MPDPTGDVAVFAPQPQMVTFVIAGQRIVTALYNFLDLPAKHAIEVYQLEDDMRAAGEDFAKRVEVTQAIVRRLCPDLTAEQLDALVPSQLLAAITASHGVQSPRDAGVAVASPSPSAPSSTGSPESTPGAPTT